MMSSWLQLILAKHKVWKQMGTAIETRAPVSRVTYINIVTHINISSHTLYVMIAESIHLLVYKR